MVLSDLDILERLNQHGGIAITPFGEKALQACSVDLRLGSKFKRGIQDIELAEGEKLTLQPGDFVLGATLESVGIPLDLVGQLDGRSGLGRLGLAVHSTASFIWPGFSGNLTLELKNLDTDVPISLWQGKSVCTLLFHKLSSPTGNGYKGVYAGQNGPVSSRLELGLGLGLVPAKEINLGVNLDLVRLLVHGSRDNNSDLARIAEVNLAEVFGGLEGNTWLNLDNGLAEYTVKRNGAGGLVIACRETANGT
ncbi:MAG: dCTP deaminase [Chloroflexota bacterium]